MAQKRIQKTKKHVKRESGNEASPVSATRSQRSSRMVSQSTVRLAEIDSVLASNRR